MTDTERLARRLGTASHLRAAAAHWAAAALPAMARLWHTGARVVQEMRRANPAPRCRRQNRCREHAMTGIHRPTFKFVRFRVHPPRKRWPGLCSSTSRVTAHCITFPAVPALLQLINSCTMPTARSRWVPFRDALSARSPDNTIITVCAPLRRRARTRLGALGRWVFTQANARLFVNPIPPLKG